MFKPRKSICVSCQKECIVVVKKLLCAQCNHKSKGKKITKIKPLSDKRKRQNDEYLLLRKQYLKQYPACEVKLSGCTKTATEIHHARKRTGSMLTNEKYFVAICRNCHTRVENLNIKTK